MAYDVLIHECSIPLDVGIIKGEIPGHAIYVFDKADDEVRRRYTPQRLFEKFGVPRVFVRGHVPNAHLGHSPISLVSDIKWLKEKHPEVYIIAFKDEMSAAKIRMHVHAFVHRRGNLEEELGKEIAKGLREDEERTGKADK